MDVAREELSQGARTSLPAKRMFGRRAAEAVDLRPLLACGRHPGAQEEGVALARDAIQARCTSSPAWAIGKCEHTASRGLSRASAASHCPRL